jgi:hypothetical protein
MSSTACCGVSVVSTSNCEEACKNNKEKSGRRIFFMDLKIGLAGTIVLNYSEQWRMASGEWRVGRAGLLFGIPHSPFVTRHLRLAKSAAWLRERRFFTLRVIKVRMALHRSHPISC